MKNRKEVIKEMCKHYRDDYLEDKKPDDPSWARGMSDKEREGLHKTMDSIYDKIMSHYERMKSNK